MQNILPSRLSQLLDQNNNELIQRNFICPICLDLFLEPHFESKNKHTFCNGCIKNLKLCPMCRAPIQELKFNEEIQNQMSKLSIKCSFVDCPWQGHYQNYIEHEKICDIKYSFIMNEIITISNKMRSILEKEINPHLRGEHLEIFNLHCKQWNFLETDGCKWQQWWYCNNPWWNNTPCVQCNILYEKRRNKLDNLDIQRIEWIHKKGIQNQQIV